MRTFSETQPSAARNPGKEPHPNSVVKSQLTNGLTLLTKEIPGCPIVSTVIFYRVGSRNEEPGQTGKSHFLEHMLFKGTRKYPKGSIDQITLSSGGTNNAFTSEDCTAYYFDFSADRFEVALDIESDRMVDTQFPEVEYQHEKQVVIEELKINLDSPWGALEQEVHAMAFKMHPYHHPVVGWIEDLERATRDEMQAYYRKFYHPNNAILVLVGGIQTDRVVNWVESKFGSIPAGPPAPPVHVVEPPQRGERQAILKHPTQLERLHVAYHAPAASNQESFALRLGALALAGGRSSRLYRRLIEQDRTAVNVSAEFSETIDPTLFEIRAEVVPGKSVEEVEQAVTQEVTRLTQEPLLPADLQKTQNMVEAGFEFGRERPLQEAIQIGHAELLMGFEYYETYAERTREVTREQVQASAQKFLTTDNRTVGRLLLGN
ncbi:MAG: pitrilysin family protein [Acidobacteriia bacterium]|nr:pitrilysin family protein [Terriglobia bacterium]